MHTCDLYTVIMLGISLIGIWYLYFSLFPDLLTDIFRHTVFSLRDKMFDEASHGLIDFNHPAYGILRGTMNGYIRFAHRFDLWASLVALLFVWKTNNTEFSFDKQWEEAISDLEPTASKRLEQYKARLELISSVFILIGSPITTILLFLILLVPSLVIFLYAVAKAGMAWFLRLFLFPIDRLQTTAMAYGELK